MEQFNLQVHRGRRPTFDQAPTVFRRKVFGVDYLHLRGLTGGDLYVTREGWRVVDSLLPSQWFVGEKFCKVGKALAGATGSVYRVPVARQTSPRFALVVKFSRMAQAVHIAVMDPALRADASLAERIDEAYFLPPFEEFAHAMGLRQADGPTIRTSMPLAIYCPSTLYADWELGRSLSAFDRLHKRLANDQADMEPARRVDLHPERMAICLYRWVDGIDAEQAHGQGRLTESQMRELTDHARDVLAAKGFVVLDHKPMHVIVRPTSPNTLRYRDGRPIWAVIDYELLQPL